ncbi:MAG: VOC family protein [Phycisphaerales bacterium]|nr:VOC family protein [Phycisphaerales bacterium]
MGITGVHHVAIICSDIERAKAFYVGALGLVVVREVYRSERASWKVDLALSDGSQLELFTFERDPKPPPRPTRPEALGLRHLALCVSDLDAEVTRLAAQGIIAEPVRIDEYTDKRFTFIMDPDHQPIELYESI